jgi:uncharacterized protein involved in copper resistance
MSRVVKTVVMWLIALAIPAQGMAAVGMPLCPLAHHAGTGVTVDHHATDHVQASNMAASADHSMHDGMHHGTTAAPDTSNPGGHPVLKCCSAACAMAAVMPQVLATLVRARPPSPQQVVAHFHLGVTPDGLDRPPKSVLA